MKLKTYEVQVIELMLKNKLSLDEWTVFLESYKVIKFDYTGAGYYLKILLDNLNFKKETIHEPVVMGQTKDFDLGFLLFLEANQIVLECHSWGEIDPPKNLRELEIEIKINK